MPHILRAVRIAIDAGTSTGRATHQRHTVARHAPFAPTEHRQNLGGTPSGRRTQSDSIFTVEHATTPGVMPACVPHP
ncbi:hypothetical protein [Corynebacterium pseudokroppenstedtii]|uniref:hypothetical protein n=1 Tax=Corynebacterium pseudokroppenstedtii TaxID=2804917 RepID=UPI003078D04A